MKTLIISSALVVCLLLLPASCMVAARGTTGALEQEIMRPVTNAVPGLFPVLTGVTKASGTRQFGIVHYCLLPFVTASADSVSFMMPAGRAEEIRGMLKARGTRARLQIGDIRGGEQDIKLRLDTIGDTVVMGWYKACSNAVVPYRYGFYFGPTLPLILFRPVLWRTVLVWAVACVAVILAAWALLRARGGRTAWAQAAAAAGAVILTGLLVLAVRTVPQGFDRALLRQMNGCIEARELSEAVVIALEGVYRESGSYPRSLNDVWPEPPGTFSYSSDGTSYTLESVDTAPGFRVTRQALETPAFDFLTGDR